LKNLPNLLPLPQKLSWSRRLPRWMLLLKPPHLHCPHPH
jgi:hypothetical protein